MSAVGIRAPRRSWLLDGTGKARLLDAAFAENWTPEQGDLWVELETGDGSLPEWLVSKAGLSPESAALFVGSGAWPRVVRPGAECVLLVLRLPGRPRAPVESRISTASHGTAEFHETAESHDTAALCLWIEEHRILSLTSGPIFELDELRRRLADGTGPSGPEEMLLLVVEAFADRVADVVIDLRARLADLELELESSQAKAVARLRRIRRGALEWQRYAEPLRDMLIRLRTLDLPWFSTEHPRFHGAVDFFSEETRELETVVDHSRALHEYLEHRTSEQMNQRLYVLTLVSTILIPVSVVVDVFGANISTKFGNIMGADDPRWFLSYLLFLVVFGWLVFLVIRRWLK